MDRRHKAFKKRPPNHLSVHFPRNHGFVFRVATVRKTVSFNKYKSLIIAYEIVILNASTTKHNYPKFAENPPSTPYLSVTLQWYTTKITIRSASQVRLDCLEHNPRKLWCESWVPLVHHRC